MSSSSEIYLLDLWSQVPFYNAYLCQALKEVEINCTIASPSFHLEPDYFSRIGLQTDPGLFDIVSKLGIRGSITRRALRFIEFCFNIAGLTFRWARNKPQIVHVQWVPLVDRRIPLEVWFLKFLKRRGIKLVYTVHNILPHDLNRNLTSRFRALYHLMDILICHTLETRERLIHEFGLDERRVSVIPHGPLFYDSHRSSSEDAKSRLGLSPHNPVVLCQGNVRPYKGIEFLLEAWREVQTSQPTARLLIVGTGEKKYLDLIRARVAHLQLEPTVKLVLNYVQSNDLSTYYSAADLTVYTHREVTQSGALMTGVAFGKPIIASDLPAFREALCSVPSSRFVTYGNVLELSQLLIRLLAYPEERRQVSPQMSAHDCRECWLSIAQRTRDCYERVLSGNFDISPSRSQQPDHHASELSDERSRATLFPL